MTSISLSTFRYDSAAGPGPRRYASPHGDVLGLAIGLGVHRDRGNAELVERAHHPHGDLAAVRHQHFRNIGAVMLSPDRLILVRHGESIWNAAERLQGQLDPPLSDRGREQSRALAAMLDGVPGDRMSAATSARARETAELMGLQPGRFDPRWREIDVG